MPLNATVLKENIMIALEAEGFKRSEYNEKFIATISEAIVTTLTTQALVIGVCPPGGGPLAGGMIK